MWGTIEGLEEIQNNHVCLPPTIQAIDKFMYQGDELGFTTALCSETMLAVGQEFCLERCRMILLQYL